MTDRDPLWQIKHGEKEPFKKDYEDIYLPKNSAYSFFIGVLSFIFGFAFIWHIWWLAIISFLAILIALIIKLSEQDDYLLLKKEEVKKMESTS